MMSTGQRLSPPPLFCFLNEIKKNEYTRQDISVILSRLLICSMDFYFMIIYLCPYSLIFLIHHFLIWKTSSHWSFFNYFTVLRFQNPHPPQTRHIASQTNTWKGGFLMVMTKVIKLRKPVCFLGKPGGRKNTSLMNFVAQHKQQKRSDTASVRCSPRVSLVNDVMTFDLWMRDVTKKNANVLRMTYCYL